MSDFNAVRDRVVPQRQHSVEEVRRLFGTGSSGKLATEVITTNRAYYESVRRQAIADGILDAPREHFLAAHYRNKAAAEATRQLSDDDVRAVAEFSKETCERYLRQSGNSGVRDNLSTMPPERYAIFRRAAVAHGLLQERLTQPDKTTSLLGDLASEREQADAGKVQIGADLARRLNLPETYRASQDELNRLVTIAAEIQLAKQQAEADRAATDGDK